MIQRTRRFVHAAFGDRVRWLLIPVLAAGGCTGTIVGNLDGDGTPGRTPGGEGSNGGGGDDGATGGSTGAEPLGPAAAPPALRRLTHAEYLGALAKVTGISTNNYLATLQKDPIVNDFDNQASALQAGFEVVEDYQRIAADAVTRTLATSGGEGRMFPGCQPLAKSCLLDAIKLVGRRAFRRPLTAEEAGIVQDAALDAQGNLAKSAASSILESLFLSPQFMYRIELGLPEASKPGFNRLTDYEIASALSLSLWRETPDDSLLDMAEASSLSNPATLDAQVREMLENAKASASLESFATQWLRFSKIPNISIGSNVAGFDAQLRTSAAEEVRRLVQRHFTTDTNALDFVDSPTLDIDDRLADVYGYPKLGNTGFREVAVKAGDDRRGLFGTVGFFLSTSQLDHSSVIAQGLYVRNVMLCDELPAPPAAVVAEIGSNPNAQSSEYRLSAPLCAACHVQLDLIGRGLGGYNVFGARDPEVAASATQGTIDGYEDSDFSGPAGLAREIQETGRVPRCMVEHTLTWLYGRGVSSGDEPAIAPLLASFEESNFRFKEILAKYFTSDAFIYRKAGTP